MEVSEYQSVKCRGRSVGRLSSMNTLTPDTLTL